ncbi:MAG: hypothetical protein Q7R54_03170 [bacterium]|nr:hypothetical protein [bacterium]
MKKYSREELIAIISKVPTPIQELLESTELNVTLTAMAVRQKLHIDQIGVLAQLNMHMLLGLINPQEFQNELIGAGIQEPQAREIITEINQKIFVPLQQKMREGSGVGKPTTQVDVPSYKPPPTPPMPRPPIQVQPMPRPMPLPPPNLPGVPVEAPNHLLPDHEEKHINVPATNIQRPTANPQARPPMLQPSIPPASSPQPPAPRVKPLATYSVDPYREAFDEK